MNIRTPFTPDETNEALLRHALEAGMLPNHAARRARMAVNIGGERVLQNIAQSLSLAEQVRVNAFRMFAPQTMDPPRYFLAEGAYGKGACSLCMQDEPSYGFILMLRNTDDRMPTLLVTHEYCLQTATNIFHNDHVQSVQRKLERAKADYYQAQECPTEFKGTLSEKLKISDIPTDIQDRLLRCYVSMSTPNKAEGVESEEGRNNRLRNVLQAIMADPLNGSFGTLVESIRTTSGTELFRERLRQLNLLNDDSAEVLHDPTKNPAKTVFYHRLAFPKSIMEAMGYARDFEHFCGEGVIMDGGEAREIALRVLQSGTVNNITGLDEIALRIALADPSGLRIGMNNRALLEIDRYLGRNILEEACDVLVPMYRRDRREWDDSFRWRKRSSGLLLSDRDYQTVDDLLTIGEIEPGDTSDNYARVVNTVTRRLSVVEFREQICHDLAVAYLKAVYAVEESKPDVNHQDYELCTHLHRHQATARLMRRLYPNMDDMGKISDGIAHDFAKRLGSRYPEIVQSMKYHLVPSRKSFLSKITAEYQRKIE